MEVITIQHGCNDDKKYKNIYIYVIIKLCLQMFESVIALRLVVS